jgi:hypothetical protein
MNREEFQTVCKDVVDADRRLALRDVLDLAHRSALSRNPLARLRQKLARSPVPLTVAWLEVTFFFDAEVEDYEFYGVKPVSLDTRLPPEQAEDFSVMPIVGEPGEPQPVDWPAIAHLCDTFNATLPAPIAIPVVRVAVDGTRLTSLYFPLKTVTYP